MPRVPMLKPCSVQEAAEEHDSCTNNLFNGLKELGFTLAEDPRYGSYTPCPFNLWFVSISISLLRWMIPASIMHRRG